jgi:Cdc6-like AAA superfamily ATPase
MSEINPFSPTFPVNPEYFANRKETTASFKTALKRSIKTTLPTPDNIAVLGDWGIGKTSVLKKFEAITLETMKDKGFSAIIELGPTTCKSFLDFSKNIIEDIDTKFTATAPIISKIRRELKDWRLRTIGWAGTAAERKIKLETPTATLKNGLIKLWGILEKSGVETAVILLDDIHYLAEKCPDGLYDLRGIFQGLPKHGCNYILCITGTPGLFTSIRELAEPLSRFFNIKHQLTPFTLEETKEAIQLPLEKAKINLKLDRDVITKIHSLTAGHPYFIHFIMREIVSRVETTKVTLSEFKNIYQKIEKIMAREKFGIDLSIASDKEKEILSAAAKLSQQTFSPSDLKIKDARTKLPALCAKKLLVKADRGKYKIYHPLFKEYLRGKKVSIG